MQNVFTYILPRERIVKDEWVSVNVIKKEEPEFSSYLKV
jgi:hypothetical protein